MAHAFTEGFENGCLRLTACTNYAHFVIPLNVMFTSTYVGTWCSCEMVRYIISNVFTWSNRRRQFGGGGKCTYIQCRPPLCHTTAVVLRCSRIPLHLGLSVAQPEPTHTEVHTYSRNLGFRMRKTTCASICASWICKYVMQYTINYVVESERAKGWPFWVWSLLLEWNGITFQYTWANCLGNKVNH